MGRTFFYPSIVLIILIFVIMFPVQSRAQVQAEHWHAEVLNELFDKTTTVRLMALDNL